MKLSFSLCLILICIGLSVVSVEGKRTTKSRSYSSKNKYVYSSSSSEQDPDRTYCEVLDLPQTCTLEYVPVCAHIRGCEGDNCFETAGNVCAACKDSTYDYFVSGECPGKPEQEEESSGDNQVLCELVDFPGVCPPVYDPVCAHLRDCEGDNCFETVGDGCTACSSEGKYDYFVAGECPKKEEEDDGRVLCELADFPGVCPAIYEPVCARLRDCEGDNCSETVGNGCTACSSEGKYDSFVSGECQGESEQEEEGGLGDDTLYCELLDMPAVCPASYDPVCAHVRNCEGDDCFDTVGNGCLACSWDGKYDYFVSGECQEDGGSENEEEGGSGDDILYCDLVDVPEACNEIYDPVCAHLRDCEGDNCSETVGNGCTACSSEGKYDYFVAGECPKQEDRVLCELADFPGVCPAIYEPVCAHLRDCEGDNCSETVGNGCTACSSEGKYDSFIVGECPKEEEEDDGRVLCELADFPGVCPAIYEPVCARLRDCEGDNCSETVGNGCTACSSEGKYDSFIAGECPEEGRLYCDLVDVPEVCTQIYDPVCAHLRNCEGEGCLKTEGNGCTACSQRGKYDYLVPGECPEPEKKYCDDNDRPDFCTKEYFPVCAHHCEGDDYFSTAGNPCMACFDHTVDYYTFGSC